MKQYKLYQFNFFENTVCIGKKEGVSEAEEMGQTIKSKSDKIQNV